MPSLLLMVTISGCIYRLAAGLLLMQGEAQGDRWSLGQPGQGSSLQQGSSATELRFNYPTPPNLNRIQFALFEAPLMRGLLTKNLPSNQSKIGYIRRRINCRLGGGTR